MKTKNATVFLTPVDHVTLGLFDYTQIVRHPMDLGTVDRKLNAVPCEYNGPNECINDVRLVFRNAFLYNKADHWVTKVAEDLSIKFEALLGEL